MINNPLKANQTGDKQSEFHYEVTIGLLRRLNNVIANINAPSLDPWIHKIVTSFRPAISKVVNEFGELSRACYLIKYSMACQVFSEYVCRRIDHSVDHRIEPFRLLFDWLWQDLSYHLDSVVYSARIRTERVEHTKKILNGRTVIICCYRKEVYNQNLKQYENKIKSLLVNITNQDTKFVQGNKTYLYCITEDDQLIIFNHPLSLEEMITGVRYKGVLVKHPHLAQHHELKVRCAGDIWLVKGMNNEIAGILATRASGQYRPPRKAIWSILEIGTKALGLTKDTIAIVDPIMCEYIDRDKSTINIQEMVLRNAIEST